jgi:hypothetical protein
LAALPLDDREEQREENNSSIERSRICRATIAAKVKSFVLQVDL